MPNGAARRLRLEMAALMPKREFKLIRHGATAMNAEGGSGIDRVRGHLDVPLNREGRREAKALAAKLADSGIKKIACSDLSRACATAEAIAETTGAKVFRDGDLRPWDLGKFTGQESIKVSPQIMLYAKDKPDQKIPQGESFDTFRKRAFGGLLEALEKGADAVVTHHRVERLIKAWIAQGERPDGEICFRTFGKKGEHPAHAEDISLDVGALKKAAHA